MPYIVAAVTTVVVIVIAVVVEWSLPDTRRVARTVLFNSAYGLVMSAWASFLQPIAAAEAAFVKRTFNLSPIPLPEHGPLILFSALVVMLAEDLIFYWVHRAQHHVEFLWAMHSFHHSDHDVNVTSSYRHYWLEKPVWLLVLYLPLGLVFRISTDVAAVYGLMFLFFALFPHMNARIELGPLTRLFLGPQLHRIHHSIYAEHYNTNFCGAFPMWDLLFGTYRAPAPGEFPPTGVPSLPGTPGPLQTMLWPLQKDKVSAEVPSETAQLF